MVNDGYKQTDAGLIPNEWSCFELRDIITVLTDYTANGSFASLAENVTYLDTYDYARLVRLTDIRANFRNPGVYVSKSSYDFLKKSKLFGGELLLANVGAYAGYSFLFSKAYKFRATLGPNMFLIKLDESMVDSKYVFRIFEGDLVFKQLLDKAASSAQPKLNKENVRECLCILPPLPEQTAIAEALSDVDDLITSLEKLIEKKKAIKQGAMQELLKGKKRLPGFSGEWRTVKLGDVVDVFNGDRGANYPSGNDFIKYGIPFINAGHLQNGHVNLSEMDYISLDHYNRLGGAKIQSGDLLFCLRGSLGKYALVSFDNAAPASSLCVIRCKSSISNNYLFQLLGSEVIKKQIINTNTGSSQPNLSADNIRCFSVLVPVDIKEQESISNILSDMDSEVEQLYEQLNKYYQIKQGMMSELLTGKIRLI